MNLPDRNHIFKKAVIKVALPTLKKHILCDSVELVVVPDTLPVSVFRALRDRKWSVPVSPLLHTAAQSWSVHVYSQNVPNSVYTSRHLE